MILNLKKFKVTYAVQNNPKKNHQIMDGDELICLMCVNEKVVWYSSSFSVKRLYHDTI